MTGQYVALCALAKGLVVSPKCAAILMALYDARHPMNWRTLAESTETTGFSIKTYICHLRTALGPGCIASTEDRLPSEMTGYWLTRKGREEVDTVLTDMFTEIQAYFRSKAPPFNDIATINGPRRYA